MWSCPVTLGGGMTSENFGFDEVASARPTPLSTQRSTSVGSIASGSKWVGRLDVSAVIVQLRTAGRTSGPSGRLPGGRHGTSGD